MPNWCWNHLEVMCTKEHIAELQKFVKKSTMFDTPAKVTKIKNLTGVEHSVQEFSFEGTLPRGDREDWYNWSCENWGTKWDACEPHVNELEPQCFSVGFDTAWSPPTAWLRNIMDDYPNLEFVLEYDEPGMCFGGKTIVHGAQETFHDECWEIESASECCKAKVFYEDDEKYTLEDGDFQCSECKEDCETISMKSSEIKNND